MQKVISCEKHGCIPLGCAKSVLPSREIQLGKFCNCTMLAVIIIGREILASKLASGTHPFSSQAFTTSAEGQHPRSCDLNFERVCETKCGAKDGTHWRITKTYIIGSVWQLWQYIQTCLPCIKIGSNTFKENFESFNLLRLIEAREHDNLIAAAMTIMHWVKCAITILMKCCKGCGWCYEDMWTIWWPLIVHKLPRKNVSNSKQSIWTKLQPNLPTWSCTSLQREEHFSLVQATQIYPTEKELYWAHNLWKTKQFCPHELMNCWKEYWIWLDHPGKQWLLECCLHGPRDLCVFSSTQDIQNRSSRSSWTIQQLPPVHLWLRIQSK